MTTRKRLVRRTATENLTRKNRSDQTCFLTQKQREYQLRKSGGEPGLTVPALRGVAFACAKIIHPPAGAPVTYRIQKGFSAKRLGNGRRIF
jgi:hypothetical protein